MGTNRQESTVRSEESPTVVEMYVFMIGVVVDDNEGSVERVRWMQGCGEVPPSPV